MPHRLPSISPLGSDARVFDAGRADRWIFVLLVLADTFPVADARAGGLYLNESLTLGASFTYANLGDSEVRTGSFVGDCDENDLDILGATLAFKRLPWSGKLTF